MSVNYQFPFCSVIKQNDIKEAIILNLINPRIGGVLIDGAGGSAKSVLAASAGTISELKMVKLPLNISEDRLTGSIDVEQTLKTGKAQIEKGVLSAANGGILLIDDVPLLSDEISDILIDVLSNGRIRVEREGISFEECCSFLMIATMDSSKQQVRPALIDHFGLYTKAESLNGLPDRVEIMRVRDSFDYHKAGDYVCPNEKMQELRAQIERARLRLANISLSEDILTRIIDKVLESNAEGHRADLVMQDTVKAVAAFHEREEVTGEDIDEAAYFVLPHRMKPGAAPEEEEKEEHEHDESEKEDSHDDSDTEEAGNDKPQEENRLPEDPGDDDSHEDNFDTSGGGRFKTITKAFATGDDFRVIDFSHTGDRQERKGTGRRTQTKTTSASGRYIYPTMTRKNNDLALDATIRAAAPFQKKREKSGLAITLRDEDIREKVRQKKISNLLVFVVDASGSMGAVRRMTEAKGAVLSLLKDAYVKRDKVGMVTFSGEGAQVVLPPTRSTQRGYRMLEDIKTGGRTPLNAGIEKGLRVIESQLRQNPDIMPMLIVITDGRGNMSIDTSKKPAEELMDIGELVSKEKRLESMVIDIENNSLTSFGIAGRLAKAMKAKYYRLDEIKSSQIEAIVRKEKA